MKRIFSFFLETFCVLFLFLGVTACEQNTALCRFVFNHEVISSEAVPIGKSITPPTFEKDGYEFSYWTHNDQPVNFPFEVTEDVTFTAVATPIVYGIEYELNGGRFTSDAPTSYTVEDAIILPIPERSETYFFKGWYTDENPIPQKELILALGSFGDQKFYAAWESFFTNENGVLIVESQVGQSELLLSAINDTFEVDVKNVASNDFPDEVLDLRGYTRIILNNIANSDLPIGFDEVLKAYVNDYGGGLLTVGGNDENGAPHAYNKDDLYGTLFSQLLPVEPVKPHLSVGAAFILDLSGSMSYFNAEIKNALSDCISNLYDDDYVGLFSLSSQSEELLSMTPVSQKTKILSAINGISEANGGSVAQSSIEKAATALNQIKNVAKRHIVMITDGYFLDDPNSIGKTLQACREQGITLSICLLGDSTSILPQIRAFTELSDGRCIVINDDLARALAEEFRTPALRDIPLSTFSLTIKDPDSPLLEGLTPSQETPEQLALTLNGFYFLNAKTDAIVVLSGPYDFPVYTWWAYGKGIVGSFACDLNGTWSQEFLNGTEGIALLNAILKELFVAI